MTVQTAIKNRDIQGLSEALGIFNVVVSHGDQNRIFGDAYLDDDQKEIFFPDIDIGRFQNSQGIEWHQLNVLDWS